MLTRMDEVNVPQTGGDPGWPEAPGQAAGRRLGTRARWVTGVGGAVALAGACVLGVTVASGGGSPQAARAALIGAGAPATGGVTARGNGGSAAAAGSSGFAATSAGGQASAPARGGRPRLHACVASARLLRATGHRAAARARLRACLSRYLGAAKARLGRLALLARRAMHGQITVATKNGPKTIAFERGTVQSVSGNSVVVKAADGVTWTWQVGSETRVFRDGTNGGVAALAAGQRVAVGGLVSGATDQARRIVIRDSSPSRT
jgi:hypothetical protein